MSLREFPSPDSQANTALTFQIAFIYSSMFIQVAKTATGSRYLRGYITTTVRVAYNSQGYQRMATGLDEVYLYVHRCIYVSKIQYTHIRISIVIDHAYLNVKRSIASKRNAQNESLCTMNTGITMSARFQSYRGCPKSEAPNSQS